jgi:hypothetical protein
LAKAAKGAAEAPAAAAAAAFRLRPARFGDLGAASALLVHAFFGNQNQWFVPMCMTEMGRLQDNFPKGPPASASEPAAAAAAADPAAAAAAASAFNAWGSGAASFFGFGAERAAAAAAQAAALPRPGFQAYVVAERAAASDEDDAHGNIYGPDAGDAVAAAARRLVGFAQVDFRAPVAPRRDDAPRPYMSDLAVKGGGALVPKFLHLTRPFLTSP